MLYKFKSKATGNLIMLEPQGRQVVKIMGKEPGPQGIVTWSEIPAAIAALQAAVAQEEAAAAAAVAEEDGASDAADRPPPIGLRQRVVPLIDMLRRAHAEEADVVWGV